MNRIARFRVAALAGLVSCAVASAADPTMPAVTLPIDGASIVTAITAIGVVLLLLVFGPTIGFSFVKKLFKRLKSVV